MKNHHQHSSSGGSGKNRSSSSSSKQVAAAPNTNSTNITSSSLLLENELHVGKPISIEDDVITDHHHNNTTTSLSSSLIYIEDGNNNSHTNEKSSLTSISTSFQPQTDDEKPKRKPRSNSTFASLHSGYFKHTDNLIHNTSTSLLSSMDSIEKSQTAAPPTSPTLLRVNESIDEKFNYKVINAIKQIHAEGERSMSGTFFSSSTEDGVSGILSNISSKHETANDIMIEPNEIFMNFNNLSKDEIEIIISFLPMEENLNMGLTSKNYYYLTIEDKFWKSILLSLPQRERINMQTVIYQLDIQDSEYNYNFSDFDTVYTPLNTISEKIKPLESKSDIIPQIGSINDNVTKFRSRESSLSSTKSLYSNGQELRSNTHLKRIPLKHQYILYKHHSKVVQKKERGKRAGNRIDVFFNRRCQPCIYIQLCILCITTLLFITLSLIFSGLYFDKSLAKESADTLITVSPVGFSLMWLPIFFVFIFSLYLMIGWVPYLSPFFLKCYNRFHVKKANDESTSLLHPSEEDSNDETSVFFVVLRRLFFSSEMQENINDPNYQLTLAAPSQLLWFAMLVLVIALRFLFFKDQPVWRFVLIPVYIFLFIASMDFTYRGVRLWQLKSPYKRTTAQLLTILLLLLNVNLIYLSAGTSLFLASFKLDELSFTEHVKWSEILTPSYFCLLLIHFNISLIPYYAAKIFYNGFQTQRTTLLAIFIPIPIVILLLSPFTAFLILLSLRLDNVIAMRYTLVLAPLYAGLSLYLLAVAIFSLVKFVKSKCCK